MFRKARWKFVKSAMIAMITLILILVASINVVNTIQTDHRLSTAMDELILSVDRGRLLSSPGISDEGEGHSRELDPVISPEGVSRRPSMFGKGKGGRHSALSQYSGRFFSVFLKQDGSSLVLSDLEESDIASAKELAEEIKGLSKDQGYLNDYLYHREKLGEHLLICFLDCSTEFSAMKSLLLISALIALVGLILAFSFIYRMSGKAVEPLEESMSKQKRFITDAGHELKTPLGVIATNMDVLEMDGVQNEWIASTKRQVGRMRSLIGSLISLARLEEDESDLILQNLSLSAAVRDCVETFQMMAEMKGIAFESEIEDNLIVQTDEGSVQQILTILCDNAVKYAVSRVTVRARRLGKKICFETVNDWRREIAEADLSRMFDRFYRADQSRKKDTKSIGGYGLGLSIAKAAADRCQLELSVLENQEKELVFRLTFKG